MPSSSAVDDRPRDSIVTALALMVFEDGTSVEEAEGCTALGRRTA